MEKILRILNHNIAVRGLLLRTATIKSEHLDPVDAPQEIIDKLQSLRCCDIFSFVQCLPNSRPLYDYPMEWDNLAAIPISTHEIWLSQQIHKNVRNKLKKAIKANLDVREVEYNDEFVRGIMEIHDEVPIRQGRPFAYYKDPFDKVKMGYGTFPERSTFIAAYHEDEMIGFFKLVDCGGYARSMGLLTKLKHRNIAPMNALISKAVEICADRGHPYLVYGRYDYGKIGAASVAEFKFHNGFEHLLIPRYQVPITAKGRLALSLGVHNGFVNLLPKEFIQTLRDYKVSYYENKHRHATAAAT